MDHPNKNLLPLFFSLDLQGYIHTWKPNGAPSLGRFAHKVLANQHMVHLGVNKKHYSAVSNGKTATWKLVNFTSTLPLEPTTDA